MPRTGHMPLFYITEGNIRLLRARCKIFIICPCRHTGGVFFDGVNIFFKKILIFSYVVSCLTSTTYPPRITINFSVFPLDNKYKNLLWCGQFSESRLLELTLGKNIVEMRRVQKIISEG